MRYEPSLYEPEYDNHGASEGPVRFGRDEQPYTSFNTAVFARWPGPPSYISRQWYPNQGAHAGMRATGDKSDWSGFAAFPLPPLYIPRATLPISVNSASQQFYSSSTNRGIPGIFVPSSQVSDIGGRATQ